MNVLFEMIRIKTLFCVYIIKLGDITYVVSKKGFSNLKYKHSTMK